MNRAATETLGMVVVVLGLLGCGRAVQENEAPDRYGDDSVFTLRRDTTRSEAACRPKGGAPTIKGFRPAPGRDTDSIGPPNSPTWVDLTLDIPGITAINELDNSFQIIGLMTLVWCDPRLRDTDSLAQVRIFLDEEAGEKVGDIWWPDFAFVNGRAAPNVRNEALRIDSTGTVTYERRFDVPLQAEYRLHKFPFDRQLLPIYIRSFTWPESDLMLVKELFTEVPLKVPLGWRSIGEPTLKIRNEMAELTADHERADRAFREAVRNEVESRVLKSALDSVKNELDLRKTGGPTFASYTISISVKREVGFYLTKLIVPLFFIVGMSWAVFWADPKELNDRIGLTFTAILTIVAFQFLISDQLPRVSYQTLMDWLLLISFGFMMLTVLESVLVNRLATSKTGTEEKINRKRRSAAAIERHSRWGFLVAYVMALGVIFRAILQP